MGIFDTLKDFAGGTGIHGFGYLVEKHATKYTRFFWTVIIFTLTLYASLQLRISVICKP